jgi:dTDP-4-dehydrorhamnose 3,5-epimerase
MSSEVRFKKTTLDGVYLSDRRIHRDDRGSFEKLIEASELPLEFQYPIKQVNLSRNSRRGTVRGLHYQAHPFCESKIVQVLRGKLIDFVVDIRKESPTFLETFCAELSSTKGTIIFIPPGFAHGFQTLEDNTELIYLHSESYHPELQCGLNILDPSLNIKLPIKVAEISGRDKSYTLINQNFSGI